eukprot:g31014.t1
MDWASLGAYSFIRKLANLIHLINKSDSAIWFNLTAQALGVRALKIVYKIHEGWVRSWSTRQDEQQKTLNNSASSFEKYWLQRLKTAAWEGHWLSLQSRKWPMMRRKYFACNWNRAWNVELWRRRLLRKLK